MIRKFFLMTGLLVGLSAVTQAQSSPSVDPVQVAFEAKGIPFTQVASMLQMIATPYSQPSADMLLDFLRTIESVQEAGTPLPISSEWQNHWMSAYKLTDDQVQDLHKVAVRFALQPARR